MACEKAEELMPSSVILCGDIMNDAVPIIPECDYITIVQTLEHLENPKEVIKKCLTKCNNLVITVPYREKGFKTQEHIITGFDENSFKEFEVIKCETIRKRRNLLTILKGDLS